MCAGACVYMSVLLNVQAGRKPQVLFLSLPSLLLLFVLCFVFETGPLTGWLMRKASLVSLPLRCDYKHTPPPLTIFFLNLCSGCGIHVLLQGQHSAH